MNHRLLVAVALIAGNAHALTGQQIENMGAQCDQVMDEGQCRVALDAKDYPRPTVLIFNSTGAARVSTAAYLRIRGANQERSSDGHWLMCSRVRAACQGGDDSDDCRVARTLFSTEAPAVRAPSAASAKSIQR